MLLCSSSFCQSFTLRVINYKVKLKKHLNLSDKVFCPTSVQFSSVAQSCLTLCDPMNCSMPGLPVHHQLPELWWLDGCNVLCLVILQAIVQLTTLMKFWRHLLFSQIFYQTNLTINLLSGHCHLVCLKLTWFLDKLSLIFLNQEISQLCVSV